MRAFWTPPFLFDPIPVNLVGKELVGEFGVVPLNEEIVVVRDVSGGEEEPWRDLHLLIDKGYWNTRIALESEISKGVFPCV